MAENSDKDTEKGLDIGDWQVRRIGDNELHLTLPSGLVLRPDSEMTIEDVLSTIANYYAIRKGTVPKCCSAAEMVA